MQLCAAMCEYGWLCIAMFLLVRWPMSLAFARFASVPRAFGAHAVVLWQVYQYSVGLCEGRISKFETETQKNLRPRQKHN